MEPEVDSETVEREEGERSEAPGPAPWEAGGGAQRGAGPRGEAGGPGEESPVAPAVAPAAGSAPPPLAAPDEVSAAAPSAVPPEEGPAPPGAAAGEKWFDLRIAVPDAGGRGGEPEHEREPTPVEGSRELQVAAPPEESPEPEGLTLEDLAQEIRRVGRELFKTNRAAERNRELFELTLEELRRLSAAVAQRHAQSPDPVFLAKAALCRELLGVADALEASLAAANELLAQLQELAAEPAGGIAFRFPAARRLHAGLTTAVEAISKWADGQQLLYERLMWALQLAGVRAIESVGRSYDPALYRVVSVEQRRDVPVGTVVGEELKGYWLDGKVLRFGEVVVAKE